MLFSGGYGVRITNPILVYFGNVLFFAIIYSTLPYLDECNPSGMAIKNEVIRVYIPDCGLSIDAIGNIIYGSILISSLSIFGTVEVLGMGENSNCYSDINIYCVIGNWSYSFG